MSACDSVDDRKCDENISDSRGAEYDAVASMELKDGDTVALDARRAPPSEPPVLTPEGRVTDASGSPSKPDQYTADVAYTSGISCAETGHRATEEELHTAVQKMEELDHSLEVKFKAHLEARTATAELQALVRRELEELSAQSSRRPSREEAENTLRFLSVLMDGDSSEQSDTSSHVTPIFQTQVRFRGQPQPEDLSASQVGITDAGEQATPDGDHRAGEDTQDSPTQNYFIRRNIELAEQLGGSLAMTEVERHRLEEMLMEECQRNPYTVGEEERRQLSSIDDQLSSLGAGSERLSQPASSEGGESETEEREQDDADYLEETRACRETVARLDELQRQLRELSQPLQTHSLHRHRLAAIVQQAVAAFVSLPPQLLKSSGSQTSDLTSGDLTLNCSLDEPPSRGEHTDDGTGGESAAGSENSDTTSDHRSDVSSQTSESASSEPSEPTLDGLPTSPPSNSLEFGPNGPCAPPRSDMPIQEGVSGPCSEVTLDLRSTLSGERLADNQRHLSAELRPGSPVHWLVDVSQANQRYQLLVPRLCRKLVTQLVDDALGRRPGAQPAADDVDAAGDEDGLEGAPDHRPAGAVDSDGLEGAGGAASGAGDGAAPWSDGTLVSEPEPPEPLTAELQPPESST